MTATRPWATVPEPPRDRRGNVLATAGFWLGVVGLAVGFLPIVGLLVTVPAAALSHAGRARFRTGRAPTAGRSTAGAVLGWTGTAICLLMSVLAIVSAANMPPPSVQPAAAPAPAPTLSAVPNVVGMSGQQARDVLRAAGFTNVMAGPSTGSVAGVAAGTVTTQLPGAAALASPTDPIVLGEAAAPPPPPAPVTLPPPAAVPPAPVAAPREPAPVAEPAPSTVEPTPDVDLDRPYVPPAPQPLVSAPSDGGSAYYPNCGAARDAGAAPLHRGDPGYSSKLDRDDDGVACE